MIKIRYRKNKQMIVLSYDPASLKNMGVAVCSIDVKTKKIKVLESYTEVFDVSLENKDRRLIVIKNVTEGLIKKHGVNVVTIERSMGFGKHFVRNQLSEGTGVIKLVACQKNVPIVEISPGTLKKQITGNGRASKKEVMEAILKMFSLDKKNLSSEHEADALGVCYAYSKIMDK